MVSESALVEIGVIERFRDVDSLLRIQGQHLTQEVDSLVRHGRRQRVQVLQGGLFRTSRGHVALGGLAGKLHFVR